MLWALFHTNLLIVFDETVRGRQRARAAARHAGRLLRDTRVQLTRLPRWSVLERARRFEEAADCGAAASRTPARSGITIVICHVRTTVREQSRWQA